MVRKAIKNKKVKKESVDEKISEHLTLRQENFCRLYATDRDYFSNGTQSYIAAYNVKQTSKYWYKAAQGSASVLLSNPIISKRIAELLDGAGFNTNNVDKHLMFVINQFNDLGAKVNAIKEFNKLKNRITEKIEINEVKTDPNVEDKSDSLLKTYLHGGTRTTSKK